MSYLLIVQVSTILLPILAFSPGLIERWRNHIPPRRGMMGPLKPAVGHLLASIAMMFILHGTYKQLNGLFCGRPPAYLYATGFHLLAFWAPILVPSDASDPRLAQIIEQGDEFNIQELTARNDQRFESGHLVPRWQDVEPDVARANEIAKETALRALKRDPMGVVRLAARTFAQYWNLKELLHYARIDLGHNDLADDQIALLADRFHFATDGRIIDAPPTILQRYFLFSWPYCYFLLLSPIVGIAAVYRAREKQFALLFLIHLLIVLTVTIAFSVAPSFRYLQPASLLALFLVALCLSSLRTREELEIGQ